MSSIEEPDLMGDLAGLLSKHVWVANSQDCLCGWEYRGIDAWVARHRVHLADVIAREWLPERGRAARAEAWDEAVEMLLALNAGTGFMVAANPYRRDEDGEWSPFQSMAPQAGPRGARAADPRAEALREAADAARGMHDPVAPDCAEWADWLDARADRGRAMNGREDDEVERLREDRDWWQRTREVERLSRYASCDCQNSSGAADVGAAPEDTTDTGAGAVERFLSQSGSLGNRPRSGQEVEGVGTGAGEGAPGQDTGSAWVTRSTDCPAAPAQAHPLYNHASVTATYRRPRAERTPLLRWPTGIPRWVARRLAAWPIDPTDLRAH